MLATGMKMCVLASNMRKWRSSVQVETDESSKLGGIRPVWTRILHSRNRYLEITTDEEMKGDGK
jgi:hypothetical protein